MLTVQCLGAYVVSSCLARHMYNKDVKAFPPAFGDVHFYRCRLLRQLCVVCSVVVDFQAPLPPLVPCL
jgi:hypothetical protein